MKILQQRFQVQYQYPVFFTEGLFDPNNTAWPAFLDREKSPGTKLLFVLDAGMAASHPGLKQAILQKLRSSFTGEIPAFFLEVPGGELIKNDPGYVEEILSLVNTHGIDRHSFLVGIGGGAVLDAAGYAAAIAHRGIRHIRIPTTVLSQNDSGIGVKNGINHFGKKNFLGSFSPPFAVFNDTRFLTTLDDRQWRSGTSEAVKVALIKDASFFHWLEQHAGELKMRQMPAMEKLIFQCASLHLQHISSGDPFESGSSRPLDFGHWSAHKLEQMSSFSLLHGEAVATGIALDALYSQEMGWLTAADTQRILSLLQQLGFHLFHPELEEAPLTDGIREFREHLGGKLTIMMLRGIGQGENIHVMDPAIVKSCIATLKRLPPIPATQSLTESL